MIKDCGLCWKALRLIARGGPDGYWEGLRAAEEAWAEHIRAEHVGVSSSGTSDETPTAARTVNDHPWQAAS